jgi:hypothetical protein
VPLIFDLLWTTQWLMLVPVPISAPCWSFMNLSGAWCYMFWSSGPAEPFVLKVMFNSAFLFHNRIWPMISFSPGSTPQCSFRILHSHSLSLFYYITALFEVVLLILPLSVYKYLLCWYNFLLGLFVIQILFAFSNSVPCSVLTLNYCSFWRRMLL